MQNRVAARGIKTFIATFVAAFGAAIISDPAVAEATSNLVDALKVAVPAAVLMAANKAWRTTK